MRPVGKLAIPELKSGTARLVVRAARPVLYGLRHAETVVTRDLQVRLEPPQVSPVSTFHYVNHGGSEFVVYRATPEGVTSGVRVGDKEYPGYPAAGAGINGDAALRVAFFADDPYFFRRASPSAVGGYVRSSSASRSLAPRTHFSLTHSLTHHGCPCFSSGHQRHRVSAPRHCVRVSGRRVGASERSEPSSLTDSLAL